MSLGALHHLKQVFSWLFLTSLMKKTLLPTGVLCFLTRSLVHSKIYFCNCVCITERNKLFVNTECLQTWIHTFWSRLKSECHCSPLSIKVQPYYQPGSGEWSMVWETSTHWPQDAVWNSRIQQVNNYTTIHYMSQDTSQTKWHTTSHHHIILQRPTI